MAKGIKPPERQLLTFELWTGFFSSMFKVDKTRPMHWAIQKTVNNLCSLDFDLTVKMQRSSSKSKVYQLSFTSFK